MYLTTKTGKQKQIKDINCLKKKKVNHEKMNGRTPLEVLSDMLNKLDKDPNSTKILQSGENNDFDILYFQTLEMKQMFAKFPGIIFMDNTYNVCSEGYFS